MEGHELGDRGRRGEPMLPRPAQDRLPGGVQVIVEGYRAKGGAPRANGRTVKLSDGRNFFLGATEGAAAPR